MLQGADETWRETGVNNLASYTQLRPGSYTLLMNATSFNGGWSNTILKLPVIIKPPFLGYLVGICIICSYSYSCTSLLFYLS
jgi:hypothetical protein